MSPLFIVAPISLLVTLAVLSLVIRTYNRLITEKQLAENSFSQIEVQLKRRYDLIPSLVQAARAYLGHERETLEAVIAARQQASSKLDRVHGPLNDPAAVESWTASESALGGAISRLAMVIESYPELKANETIAGLTEALTSTENRISFARQLYNDSATTFNIRRERFPAVLFADWIGFGDNMPMLNFADQAEIRIAPKVELSTVPA